MAITMISKDGLSPIKPASLAPVGSFDSPGDMSMVHKLLKENSLYNIPPQLRSKVIATADRVMADEDPRTAITGAKIVLECDKRNLDLIKLVIPKKVETRSIPTCTTEELHKELKQILLDHPELIPVEQLKDNNNE